MSLIAFLLVIAATAQTPPPDAPPPLENGEMTYEVELLDGTVMYGRALPSDVNRTKGEGKFWIDEPDPERRNRQLYRFKSCTEEFDGREKRWRASVAQWHKKAGNVLVKFADGYGWVKKEEAEWSDRARAAALNVVEERESLEAVIVEAPATTTVNSEDKEQPEFIELWGPQAAVGFLGLVLMGVVGGLLIFSGKGDWQKIE